MDDKRLDEYFLAYEGGAQGLLGSMAMEDSQTAELGDVLYAVLRHVAIEEWASGYAQGVDQDY